MKQIVRQERLGGATSRAQLFSPFGACRLRLLKLRAGARLLRGWRRFGFGLAGTDALHDVIRGAFADGARRVVDAALSHRQCTPARATFRIEPEQGFLFLSGGKSGEIDVGKLGRIRSVLEEDAPGL